MDTRTGTTGTARRAKAILGLWGLAGIARIGGNQRDRPCYRGAASEIAGLVPFGAASRPSALKGTKCPGLAGRRQV